MIAANAASIPGNNELDAVSLWAAWLQGKVAMIYSWPPTGRMTAGYSQSDKAINFVPQSTIADKVGYAVVPGQSGACDRLQQGALRRLRRIPRRPISSCNGPARRRCRSRAACCPTRCVTPTASRTSSRSSTAQLFPTAKEYLREPQRLGECRPARSDHAGRAGLLPQLDRMCTAVWAGADPDGRRSQTAAAEWDTTTERLGVESQKAFYDGVPEAAGRHGRQHGREARHGRDALDGAVDRTAGKCGLRPVVGSRTAAGPSAQPRWLNERSGPDGDGARSARRCAPPARRSSLVGVERPPFQVAARRAGGRS